jgi:uncharacterized protein
MSAEVVGAIRDKIFPKISPDAAPAIIWHAGEPTVVPVSWYRRTHSELRRAAPRQANFSLQSNGVSLSSEWITFAAETETQIGLSIDGPQMFHDMRRKTRNGKGTWTLVMQTLRRLQAARIHPSVVTVLHPLSLRAADEYFDFYRDNGITHVSFSIDEVEGCNSTSSFGQEDQSGAIAEFQFRLLKRAYAEQYPLHIKEVERVASVLAGGELNNEQVDAWQVVVVAANGDVTTFSPEFLEVQSPAHNNFKFGNILSDDFEEMFDSSLVAMTEAQIRRGVERCKQQCRYFAICGGGAPSNKMQENGSLESSETMFCRMSVQPAAEAFRKFMQWGARQVRPVHSLLNRAIAVEQNA